MSLLNTLKYFAFLVLILSVALPSYANTNPGNTSKETAKPKVSEESIELQDQNPENNEKAVEDASDKEDEASEASHSSLNYFFYMIYKVKFEDIFKFPNRRGPQNSNSLNLLDVNYLIDYLNYPRL